MIIIIIINAVISGQLATRAETALTVRSTFAMHAIRNSNCLLILSLSSNTNYQYVGRKGIRIKQSNSSHVI